MLSYTSRLRHSSTTVSLHRHFAHTKAKPAPPRMPVSPPSAERSAELVDNYNEILKEVNDAAAAHPGKFKVSPKNERKTVGGEVC